MKTKLTLMFAIALILTGCGSKPAVSSLDELDVAIRDASDYLNDNIPSGSKIVILNIQSSSSDLSDYIIDELLANAVTDKIFSVVDRQQLDAIRAEQDFQSSGEVDDNSAMAIGKFFGAQTIISGAVNRLGTGYRIRIRALEVQTAQVQGQYNRNIASSPMIAALMESGGSSGGTGTRTAATSSGNTTASSSTSGQTAQSATPAQPPAPALPAYRIGDTGPAGGFIFYDKGNNNGGWRYLEAAPEEVEFQAVWSVHSTGTESTRDIIGSGLRNTQLIVEKFRQTSGEWDTAAQKCDDLVFGGFDDWFLPSKAELDQMYGNLKRRNLGDFKNGYYWSSTDRKETDWANRTKVQVQNFRDGEMNIEDKTYRFYVRPIRQVAG